MPLAGQRRPEARATTVKSSTAGRRAGGTQAQSASPRRRPPRYADGPATKRGISSAAGPHMALSERAKGVVPLPAGSTEGAASEG